MGKRDQNRQKEALNQDVSRTQQQSGQISGQLQDILGGARRTSSDLLPGISAGYSDILSTGGYDPSVLGNIRNMYSTYAKEGGISDAGADAIRRRAFRTAESTYENERNRAQRAGSITGNYGYSGALAGNLARKGSQAATRAVTDAEAEIAKLRQTGTLAGAQGLAGLEQSMAQNRLGALSGISNIYGLNMQEVDATIDNILKEYQLTGTLTQNNRQMLIELANRPGVYDKIISTIATLGGSAAGVMAATNPPQLIGAGGRSDKRIKKNIKILGWIGNIPIIIFEFIDKPGWKLGSIAQNVKKVFPDLVFDLNGILHVDYAGLEERLRD